MPCRDDFPSPAIENRQKEVDRLTKRNDLLAKGLCEACQFLEDEGLKVPLIIEAWWKEHKKSDVVRKEIEKAEKVLALAKKSLELARQKLQSQKKKKDI